MMQWLWIATLSAFLPLVPASDDSASADEQEKLRALLTEKQLKKFVGDGGWVLDYDEARTRATDEGKLLFIYFTRSFAP